MTSQRSHPTRDGKTLHTPGSTAKDPGVTSKIPKNEPYPAVGLVKIAAPIKTWRDFEHLIMESEPELLKTAQRFIRYDPGGADAEDILQQARLKAYEHLKKHEAYSIHSKRLGKVEGAKPGVMHGSSVSEPVPVTILSPEAWFNTILRNTGRNYYDNRKRLQGMLNAAGRDVEDRQLSEDPLYKVIKDENDKELHALVGMLPPPFAAVIELSFFADREYSLLEIADKLGYRVNTVKSYKRRALDMLREALGNQRDIKDGRIGRKKRMSQTPAA